MSTATIESRVQPKARAYSLESVILGLVGLALIWQKNVVHHLSVPAETIVLVVFLAGLMGITRIQLPTRWRGRAIQTKRYPALCGIVSGFMDSFLVLLLLKNASIKGPETDQMKFKVYCMLAALIGGLITYFGEVYFLPVGLMYNMKSWHSMLPIVPPVLLFLALLGFLASRLNITIEGVGESYHGENIAHGTLRRVGGNLIDHLEFAAAIGLLLWTHNSLLCLGVLFLYASVTGQGTQLLHVVTAEMEIAVMLLLLLAAVIAGPVAPYMQWFTGWLAVIPSTVNAVLTAAIYPTSGDVWQDAQVLSFAALLLPISSLVGVMLFKMREWGAYVRTAVPLAVVWLIICLAWFNGPWPLIKPRYEQVFGP